MPNITPTALRLELARARRDALHEAAELADRLGDQHPAVQAGALRALTTQAEDEVDAIMTELGAEVKAKAETPKPKRARRAPTPDPAPAQAPLEPPPPPGDAGGL